MANCTYVTAIQFNNEGVACLEAGAYLDARNFFKSALDTMTDVITYDGEDQNIVDDELTLEFQCSVNPKRALHGPTQVVGLGNSFIFSRALYISISKKVEKSEYIEESAAIVYNLALSFHLIGTENSSESLKKAIQFYEISAAIRSRKSETKLEILDLAILNNIGQIFVECMNYVAARQYFDQLSKQLTILNNSGVLNRFLEEKDCDGFVFNVMLDEPSLAAAAWQQQFAAFPV